MPTIGTTTKPSGSWHAWGVGMINHEAELLTMPERGRITRLAQWIGGWDSTVRTRLCVWNTAGVLLGQSAEFTVANNGAANGTVALYEADLLTPVELAAGVQFYCGFARNINDRHQLANTTTINGHREKYVSPYPGNIDGAAASDGRIGSYVANYAKIAGGRVRRSGAWVEAPVYDRRSGAWVERNVAVRRTGAWTDAS